MSQQVKCEKFSQGSNMLHTTNRRFDYKVEVDWNTTPSQTDTLDGVALSIEELRFRREKKSYRGISCLVHLRHLIAFQVNQEFLEEISELPHLEFLYIIQLTATNAECLGRCKNLRHLIIKGGTKIASLSWLQLLPLLDSLLLENFKKITDISFIEPLISLRAFGLEGSMWTTQQADSFRPIAKLPNLEALFLANCRPVMDGLEPLHSISQLRYLTIAAFFPNADFVKLHSALPNFECDWFQQIEQHGSIQNAIKTLIK